MAGRDRMRDARNRDLALRAREGDRRAGDALVRENEAFCVARIRRWRPTLRRTDPFWEDLYAEALGGLWDGVLHYDFGRGVPLMAYSLWWIDARIAAACAKASVVQAPAGGRARNPDRVALAAARARPLPLESVRAAWDGPAPDAASEAARDLAACRRLLGFLRDRERAVIRARMAGRTLAVVGEGLGITRERVRQIEKAGVERMIRLAGTGTALCDVLRGLRAAGKDAA